MTESPRSPAGPPPDDERRLRPRDRRLLLGCLVVALGCLSLGIWLYPKANPEASIRFDVDRTSSESAALEFLHSLGHDPAGRRHAAIFTYDQDAKVFLERSLGLEQTTRVLSGDVRLWRWGHRWFRPMDQEEFEVEVSTDGRVVGFDHVVPEMFAGPDLDPSEARPIAEAFLTDVAQVPLASLEFLDATAQVRPNRTDHTFTWKASPLDLAGGSYRYQVGIQGGKPGSFKTFVKVPEAWALDYESLRARNDTLAIIAGALLAFTVVAMVVVLLRRVRYRDVRWRTAVGFGAVGAGLAFLADLNGLPLEIYGYDTRTSFSAFLLLRLLAAAVQAGGMGVVILVMVAAAEPLYRDAYPDKIALGRLFSPAGFRTRRFLVSSVLGITLTCAFFAFQEVFYVVAARMGAWAPADVPYTNVVNTAFPWIFVLLVGFLPSVTEEFTSRMFSIPFLQKYLRVRWLAVIVPAVIWGFAHANYPNQPPYIRGLEVSLAGIAIGVVMLRFGILAPLVWHYLIDSLYFSLLLFRSGNTYYVISAALACGVILLPLVYAVVAYLRQGTFEGADRLRNRAQPGPIPPEDVELPEVPPRRVPPWSGARRATVVAISLGALAVAAFALPSWQLGTGRSMQVGRQEAQALAEQHVRALHEEPDSFRVAVLGTGAMGPAPVRFALEEGGLSELRAMVRRYDADFRWKVRYYRREDPREILVELSGTGELRTLRRQLAEAQARPSLDSDRALEVAEAYLRGRGIAVDSLVLRESSTEALPQRLDHTFVWEARDGDPRNVGDGHHRVRVTIQGDQVGGFSMEFRLPEAWKRDREERTATFGLRILVLILAGGLFVGLALFVLLDGHRRGLTRWSRAALLALPFIGVHMAHRLNEFPALAAAYPTAQPWVLFLVSAMAVGGMSFVFLYLLYVAGVAMISTMWPAGWSLRYREVRRGLLPDAVLASTAVLSVAYLLDRLSVAVLMAAPDLAIPPTVGAPPAVDTYWPWFSIGAETLHRWLLAFTAAGALIGVLRFRRLHPVPVAVISVLGVVALVPLETQGAAEFSVALGTRAVQIGVALALARWILRDNLLAYPLSIFAVMAAVLVSPYLSAAGAYFRIQGWVALAILSIPLLWVAVGGIRRPPVAPR